MKRGLIGKITAIVALMLYFALIFLVACGGGGSSDSGNSGGTVDGGGSSIGTVDGGGSSDSGNRGFTEAVNDVKEALTGSGNSLTIYKVGSDLIAFALKGGFCKELMPKGEWEESDTRFTLRNGDYSTQAQFSTFYTDCWWRKGEESNNAGTGYDRAKVTENVYFAAISYPGICDVLNFSGELTLESFNNRSGGENKTIAVIDGSKAVKSVDEVEFVDEVAQLLNVGTPECNWAGTYKTDRYGDAKGYVEVTVTEHGGIVLDCSLDLDDRTYVGFEKLPDGWEHDDPDYVYRHFQLLNGYGNNESKRVDFQYTWRSWTNGDTEDSLTWTYDEWTADGASNYRSASMDRFEERHVAPADYRDEDYNGYIARKDPEDETFFKPLSDDYIITLSINTTMSDMPCDVYNLYCFDANGFALADFKCKYVFKDNADAKKYYDESKKKYGDYYNYDLCDSIVYYSYKQDSDETYRTTTAKFQVMMQSGYEWYVNCNYNYGRKRDDGTYYGLMYVSKPYTEKEYKFGLTDQLYWEDIPADYYYSIENPDAYVYLGMDSYSTYFNFSGYVDDKRNNMESPEEIHINGRSVVGAKLSRKTETATGKRFYLLTFAEIECGDTEVQVTEYMFKLSDMYDTSINFDNYKSKTPDLTLTQRYALKH